MFSSSSKNRYSKKVNGALLIVALLVNTAGALSLHTSLTAYVAERSPSYQQDSRTLAEISAAAVPIRLRIPAIGVDAPIIEVGLLSTGAMDIPSTGHEIGWFEPGFLPGAQGNAVMAGHLDTELGETAVFWELRTLKAGDTVEVVRADGTIKKFIVTHQTTYDAQNAPMQELFGNSTGAHLNLITCNGAWQQDLQTYDKRLVVFTDAE